MTEERFEILTYLLNSYSENLKILNKNNKYKSILFNPLTLFDINELTHSSIIAKLLNPHSEHGQGNTFLKCFLEMLGVETPEKGQWFITKGRVDILLKRKSPNSVIIIENKSNCAIDQENQIYRYWFKEIYLPNKLLQNHVDYQSNKNFAIVYLTPSEYKKPLENSLARPDHYSKKYPDSPHRVLTEVNIWLFNKEIVNWLNKSINVLPRENHRMKEFIKQYIEFWT